MSKILCKMKIQLYKFKFIFYTSFNMQIKKNIL